ncbi:MAG: AsmA family protein [Victivallaceae bacterium]
MKKFKKILLIAFALIVVVIITVILLLNSIVGKAIRELGTRATGTQVSLDNARISLLNASVGLNGMMIANPEGYQQQEAFALGKFFVDVDMWTLASNKIIIDRLEIRDINIDFEPTLSGSNLNDIKNNIMKFAGMDKKAEVQPTEPEKEPETVKTPEPESRPAPAQKGKKLVIKKLIISNGTVTIASKMLGQNITVPLAEIEMEDVGEDSNKSPEEVLLEVYQALMKGVAKAVSASGAKNIDVEGITNSVLGAADKNAKNLGKDVKDSINKLKDSFFK